MLASGTNSWIKVCSWKTQWCSCSGHIRFCTECHKELSTALFLRICFQKESWTWMWICEDGARLATSCRVGPMLVRFSSWVDWRDATRTTKAVGPIKRYVLKSCQSFGWMKWCKPECTYRQQEQSCSAGRGLSGLPLETNNIMSFYNQFLISYASCLPSLTTFVLFYMWNIIIQDYLETFLFILYLLWNLIFLYIV